MIGMSLQIDPESRKLLEELAAAFPDAANKAFFRAASIVSRKMRARMNPRRHAVQPWQEITRRIRNMASSEDAKTFGGKLMYPNGRQIAIKPFAGGAVVGWIDALETAASKFQSGDSASTSAAWRHYLYRRGFSHDDVPKVAITPERPVVDPVAGESAGKFPEWMLGAMQTILQRRIKRASLNYSRTGATAEGSRAAATVADAYSALSMMKGAM